MQGGAVMEDSRPSKRTRQACDPCRRKKTRCPGEKPVCSYCSRLGQKCEYNENDQDAGSVTSSRKMEERMENLEGKLEQVLEQLLPVLTDRQYISPTQVPTPGAHAAAEASGNVDRRSSRRRTSSVYDMEDPRRHFPPSSRDATSPEDALLQEAEIKQAGRLYLTWCQNQPVSLFDDDTFLATLGSRDPELLLALQALCLRFPPGSLTSTRRRKLGAMSRRSRELAMGRVEGGQVDLSTLQTLCLLSMVDLSDGSPIQAGVNLVIASNLANSVPAGHTLGDPREFSNCKKSISTLQHLHGSVLPGSPLADSVLTDWQSSAAHIGRGTWQAPALPTNGNNNDFAGHRPDAHILRYAAELSEVWHMARIYAASRVGPDAPPPWSPLSDYSFVSQRHMEIDCRVPLQYRFAANKFGEQPIEALQGRREYWGPWLFLQITYAAIPCLLNHPLLLSLRLRNFRDTMPQSFIHQSFELITRHGGWITYFIDLIDNKNFQLSDPSIAHAAVIVATIHLQHSFAYDQLLREKAQTGFEKCVRFLRSMGSIWPHVSTMANNLEKLQQSVFLAPPSQQATGGLSTGAGQKNHSIDVGLLRNLLIYERAGQADGVPDRSPFGASLTAVNPQEEGQDSGAAEYDLVGSAGISGHRSVPHEIPAYPPEDVGAAQVAVEPAFPPMAGAGTGWSVADRYFDGVAVQSDYEGMGFQADDFGRAIDGWMSLDLG